MFTVYDITYFNGYYGWAKNRVTGESVLIDRSNVMSMDWSAMSQGEPVIWYDGMFHHTCSDFIRRCVREVNEQAKSA
jgi:hypothetical protein